MDFGPHYSVHIIKSNLLHGVVCYGVMEQQIPHMGHDEVMGCLSVPLFSLNSSREVHESHISGQMLSLSITLTFWQRVMWEPLETEAMPVMMLVGHGSRGWALTGPAHRLLAASLLSCCPLEGQISAIWCPGSTGALSQLPKPHQLFTSPCPQRQCAGDLERTSLLC